MPARCWLATRCGADNALALAIEASHSKWQLANNDFNSACFSAAPNAREQSSLTLGADPRLLHKYSSWHPARGGPGLVAEMHAPHDMLPQARFDL